LDRALSRRHQTLSAGSFNKRAMKIVWIWSSADRSAVLHGRALEPIDTLPRPAPNPVKHEVQSLHEDPTSVKMKKYNSKAVVTFIRTSKSHVNPKLMNHGSNQNSCGKKP
jgi:hypothetical protein